MSRNGRGHPPRARIEVKPANASPAEAAAISAALERFLAETAPVAKRERELNRWQRAALSEGVRRAPETETWAS
jgi:hypothetical protein